MTVSSYFNLFPKIKYDINRSMPAVHEEVTDIFFHVGVIKEALNNITSYMAYDISEGDTPEIVAEKVYGDAGAVWIILLANQIIDPQFEWPLDYKSFQKFIAEKYRVYVPLFLGADPSVYTNEYILSITQPSSPYYIPDDQVINVIKTTPRHYEKVITRRNTRTDQISETRFIVNSERYTVNMPNDVSFSYFKPWVSTTKRTADSVEYNATTGESYILITVGAAPLTTGDEVYFTASPVGTYEERTSSGIVTKYISANGYTVIEDFDSAIEGTITAGEYIHSNTNPFVVRVVGYSYHVVTPDLLADLDDGEEFGATLDKGNLALTGEYNSPQYYQVGDDEIEVIIKGEPIYYYDWEVAENDKKKTIKVIRSDYYTAIRRQFSDIVNSSNTQSYIRSLK